MTHVYLAHVQLLQVVHKCPFHLNTHLKLFAVSGTVLGPVGNSRISDPRGTSRPKCPAGSWACVCEAQGLGGARAVDLGVIST